jgi:hypothetical protein
MPGLLDGVVAGQAGKQENERLLIGEVQVRLAEDLLSGFARARLGLVRDTRLGLLENTARAREVFDVASALGAAHGARGQMGRPTELHVSVIPRALTHGL